MDTNHENGNNFTVEFTPDSELLNVITDSEFTKKDFLEIFNHLQSAQEHLTNASNVLSIVPKTDESNHES